MAPSLGGFGELADVGVISAGDDVGELEARLAGGRGDRLRGPAVEGDRAVRADRAHLVGREVVVAAGGAGGRALGEGSGEVDDRELLARHFLELGDGAHVPGRLVAGQLLADPGAPEDRGAGGGRDGGGRRSRFGRRRRGWSGRWGG